MGNSSIFELAYREETGGFQNPPYDEATENLLLSMREKGADSKLLEEAERCIRLGAVRADWKRQAEELEAEIEKAEGVRERNYWVCMKALCIEKND